jgi:aminomethyltransferase
MDIQGKNSARILAAVLKDPSEVFNDMPYFSFKGSFDPASDFASQVRLLDDTPILLSRSGYTGEFGFEIFISPTAIVQLWKDILTAGSTFNITPCGLGARDSLRAGAVLPLSHQDIGHWPFINHPWPFALPFTADQTGFTKDFIGRAALEKQTDFSFTQAFAGNDLRKISAGEGSRVVDADGQTIGTVLTCATDMGIGWHDQKILSIASPDLPEGFKAKGISCGFIMVEKDLEQGTRLELVEGKRSIPVTVMSDIRPDRTARKKLSHFI